MNKDLTIGNPDTVLWKFCLPLFGSIIFQQLYNIADSFVAGKFLGEQAFAAIGNSYVITLLFIAFAFGCNIGCSVITSRYFGSKDYKTMKTAITTSVIVSFLICITMTCLGLLFGEMLLIKIHTPAELLADSALYMRIYVYGVVFLFFYNIATGIFSALGDSKTPFYFLVVSSISNVIVDILFVTVFQMGVSGIAWATFLCQGISCIASWIVVMKRLGTIKCKEQNELFSMHLAKQFLKIAVPSILQQSFISVGNIIIQGQINQFGAGVIAGYSAGVKLNNLVITSFTTLGNGISNFTAQNLGAHKTDRVRAGFYSGLKMVWILSLPLCLLFMIFPTQLLRFFIEAPSAEAIKSGVWFLRILSPFYFVISAKLVADGILRGSALMKQFMIATFTDLLLRVALAIYLAKTILGYIGIWCSWPIGWIIGTALSIYFYKASFSKSDH